MKTTMAFAALTLATTSLTALGQTAQWHYNSATAGGTGCIKDVDTFISAAGDTLSIIYSALGIELPGGGSDSRLDALKNCVVNVPVTVSKGLYLGELSQEVFIGVTKTRRTRADVSAVSRFFNLPTTPVTINLPYGVDMNNPMMSRRVSDSFVVDTARRTWWCGLQRAPQGFFQTRVSVAGKRDNRAEGLIVQAQNQDVKFEVTAAVQHCGI